MAKIVKFEVIRHGYEHAQYFQGCGVAFTQFEHVVTGAGMDAREAYNDAVEQICNSEGEAVGLPKRPRGINAKDKVPASHRGEDSEFYFYVSIRYNLDTDKPRAKPTTAALHADGVSPAEGGPTVSRAPDGKIVLTPASDKISVKATLTDGMTLKDKIAAVVQFNTTADEELSAAIAETIVGLIENRK